MANPADLQTMLFQVAGNLTGGLIDDVASVLVAVISLTFILIGFEYVKDGIESALQNKSRNRALDEARKNRMMADDEFIEPVLRDVYRARYRESIRRASR